jgi:hypothetical protein
MFIVDNISYYNNFISDYIDSYNTIETINDKGMIRDEFLNILNCPQNKSKRKSLIIVSTILLVSVITVCEGLFDLSIDKYIL